VISCDSGKAQPSVWVPMRRFAGSVSSLAVERVDQPDDELAGLGDTAGVSSMAHPNPLHVNAAVLAGAQRTAQQAIWLKNRSPLTAGRIHRDDGS